MDGIDVYVQMDACMDDMRNLCVLVWLRILYIDKDGLKLLILLPPPPKCWDGRRVLPHQFMPFCRLKSGLHARQTSSVPTELYPSLSWVNILGIYQIFKPYVDIVFPRSRDWTQILTQNRTVQHHWGTPPAFVSVLMSYFLLLLEDWVAILHFLSDYI